jgi:hypothetical protein
LSTFAPSGGATVTLSSNNPSVATPPASVLVPANQKSTTFTVNTASVSSQTTVTISGSYGGATQTASITVLPQVATPTFSPVGGTYNAVQSVTISDTTSGAVIYYTTDGSTPTTSSTPYTAPISVSATTTIKAIATATGSANSLVATATYVIQLPQVATPALSPAGGTYNAVQSVTISDTTSGAVIYYTTDGSTPTSSSTRYSAPISVSSTTTIKAIATATGSTDSLVATATYVIQATLTSITPNQTVAAGTLVTETATLSAVAPTGGATVTLSSNNPSVTAPASVLIPANQTSATFTVNTASVSSQTTATISGSYGGVTQTASITVLPQQVATPTLSPAGGTYNAVQSITISDATSGALIYYTTDGSTPTSSSTPYSAPISVSRTTTIKAIAIATGSASSPVATATYVIQAADFTMSIAQSNAIVQPGQSVTETVTVAPPFGSYDGSVSLSCSGLPSLALCSFTPPSVVPGSSTATSMVTISTTAPSSAMGKFPSLPTGRPFNSTWLTLLLVLTCTLLVTRSGRRIRPSLLPIGALTAVAVLLVACSNTPRSSGTGSPGTPRGTYSVTVNGMSGTVKHSVTINLTVQ